MSQYNIIIFILIIIILFYIVNIYINKLKYYILFEYYENTSSLENIDYDNIPKIIHQTAPADKNKWKEDWYECQKSWFKHFPNSEYEYILWSDEDLDNLIKKDFNWFYPIYKGYKKNIKRIDIARYFILYKYGGIYADMDYMCIKNFYDQLPPSLVSISESPYKNNEYLQNALIASNINNKFWKYVIREAINRKDSYSILYSTGPKLLSDIYYKNKNMVNVLPEKLYNPNKNNDEDYNNKDIYCKHLFTCSWCQDL